MTRKTRNVRILMIGAGALAVVWLLCFVARRTPGDAADGVRLSARPGSVATVAVAGSEGDGGGASPTRVTKAARGGEAGNSGKHPHGAGHDHNHGGDGCPALSSRVLEDGFIAGLAAAGDDGAVAFALPDGRAAGGRVERRGFDDLGRVIDIEGTLDEPTAGRFLFREEPAPGNAAPMSGVVHLFDEEISYRVEPTGDGAAALVERPIDDVVCRGYAPPEDEGMDGGGDVEEVPADHPTDIPIPEYQNGVIPLESTPGADAVIYLDFDGEDGPHEGWGDFDALPATDLSVSNIVGIWRRVSEDYAPFDINVTTDSQVYLDASENNRQRCIITPTKNAAPSAGGVAYVGSFDWGGDRPCWAFYSRGKSSAEVIAHEIGHTLDLSHDGRSDPSQEYYGGHGSGDVGWAPIMGVGYYKNLTQWSKGEYLNANRTQDDIAIIANNNNNVGFRPDDHSDTAAAASPLEIFADDSVDGEGVIEDRDDIDVFSFLTTGGSVSLSIDPESHGPDLDILAELYDSAGVLVVSSNPDTLLDATISASLGAGEYTLRISGTGRGDPLGDGYTDYASLGSYTIAGTVSGGVGPDRFGIAENPASGAAVGTVGPRNDHGANPLDFSIQSGNSTGAFSISAATGELSVADPAQFDFEALAPGWDDSAEFELVVAISDAAQPSLDETVRVVVTVIDVNEGPVLTGGSELLPEALRVGSEVAQVGLSDPDRFQSHTWAIVSGDPDGRFQIDNDGVIAVVIPPDTGAATSYTLVIEASDSGTPSLAGTATVAVDVLGIPPGHEPGLVYRTIYDGISGGDLADMTGDASFPEDPDREVALLELADKSRGDNYGSTVRAFLIAPFTADYTFWIAGDDACELRLSSTDNPSGATVRASFSGWTDYQQWTKYAGQQSAPVSLVAGHVYYIEARQKEGGGGDHLAVAWQAESGGSTQIARQAIPTRFLAPHSMNYRPKIALQTVRIYETAYRGASVATMSATDLNPGQSHSYAIAGGNGAGVFSIDPVNGRVRVADPSGLDAYATPSYALAIAATDDGSPALEGSGTLTVEVFPAGQPAVDGPVHEIWEGISGPELASLYAAPGWPDDPDRVAELVQFDSGEKIADNYGARIRGYLIPQTTGSYNLWLASDDEGVLLLSSDEDSANAAQIASVGAWTSHLEWTKYASQKSAAVDLVAGRRYFVEARVKEGSGGDHVEVGWTGPGMADVTVLAAPDLEPYDSNTPPVFAAGSYSFSIAPEDATGTVVGDVSAASQSFESLTYAILSGDPAGAMGIDPESGRITVADTSKTAPGQVFNLQVGAQDDGYGGMFPPMSVTVPVTVQVTGTSSNETPTAHDQSVEALENQAVAITLTGSDPENDPLTFEVVAGPDHGSLGGTAPDLTYTPASGFYGIDTFTFRAHDGFSHSPAATVTVTVDGKPTAVSETLPVDGPDPVAFVLHGTDPENAPLAFTVLTTPALGTVTGNAPNLVYTPHTGASGQDYIVFRVNDGKQNSGNVLYYFDVTPAPIDVWRADRFGTDAGNPTVSGNDADPDHDGIVNLLEYALNLDPLAHPDSDGLHAGLPEIESAPGELALVYRRNLAATDLAYAVEQSPTLGAGATWQAANPSEQTLDDDGATRVIRASLAEPPSGRLFLRLRVTVGAP